jgi:LPXTG-motif cell wall-anchored protein
LTVGPATAYANAVIFHYRAAERSAFTATATTTSTRRNTPTSTDRNGQASGLSTGAKAGIGVGIALGALLLLGFILFFLRRRRKNRKVAEETVPPQEYTGKPELDGNTGGASLAGVGYHEKDKPAELHSQHLAPSQQAQPAYELHNQHSSQAAHPHSQSGEIHGHPVEAPSEYATPAQHAAQSASPIPSVGAPGSPGAAALSTGPSEQLSAREIELRKLELEEERIRQRKFELQGPQ